MSKAAHRKDLLDAYKRRPIEMGVYRVMCTVTGRSIVAASKDPRARLNRHTAALRMKAHETKALQADWNEHGESAFVFEILDTLAPSDDPGHDPIPDLTVLEDMWLEKLNVTIEPQLSIDPKRIRKPR
jgi:hypothetical protein